jgi:hypothetical protein
MRTPAEAQPVAPPIIRQFAQILAGGAAPFKTRVQPGYMRGIDFYATSGLIAAMAVAAQRFRGFHGRMPNIVDPRAMTDKIFWSKFFRPMKVPETGNKLKTGYFIPDRLHGTIACPAIVWHSPVAKVPRGETIAPGTYYLKASHGSNMFRRVTYPLSNAEADALDAQFGAYLVKKYEFDSGEWWYSSFRPELLLERSVGSRAETSSWNYYVIGGRVALIVVYQKTAEGARQAYLDPEFKPFGALGTGSALFDAPSDAAKAKMLRAAQAIGSRLGFVRIDFLLDDDERPYLGEVTFTPGNALNRWPPEFDLHLGAMWDLETGVPGFAA